MGRGTNADQPAAARCSTSAGSAQAPGGATAWPTMLLTGTTTSDHLTVTDGNLLDVGHGLDGGGDIQVAGDVVPSISPGWRPTAEESRTDGAEATSQYAGFGDDLRGLSGYLDDQIPNGALSVDGNRLHFTGTGEPGVLQVFEIDAAALGQPTVELYFRDIPDETAVVINVRGTTASLNPVWIQDENERADYFGSPRFATVAVRTLWNFTDASSLGLLGTGQILGSILAMDADQTLVTASTNGRLYVGGDLTLNGVGNELHNYHWPWSKITECTSVPEVPDARPMGRVAVAKLMYGDYSTMTSVSQQSFVGAAQCPSDQELGVPARGFRWRTMPGQVSENNSMAIGQQCTVTEMAPETPPGEGLVWGDPIMDPPDGTVVVTEDAQQVDVYIDNLLVGPFHVRKKVVGPEGNDSGFVGDRHFDIDYTCTLAGAPTDGFDADGQRVPGSASGRIQLRNGETVRSLDFATGTVCRLSEDLTSIDGEFEEGYQWSVISLAPAETVTIQAGTVSERTITVTNSFERTPVELGRFSIRKEVRAIDGGDVDSSRTFTADYSCTIEG
ncbi:MAG: choice-of-anchor A family protein, partial [Propionibacteriaceae bacterium]|nr:choice-of-anchor A family protein [Propionibacteriaceae bacterium]